MSTTLRHFMKLLMVVITLGWGFVGCGKKCQPPAQQPFTTFTGTEWRMIRTSNPRLTRDITRFTFYIMVFKSEFEGEVFRVVNNKRFDTPLFTFQYDVRSEGRSGLLRVTYSTVTGETPENSGGTVDPSQGTTPAVSKPTDYDYELRSGLNLTERKTGYLYEFLPFVGIVEPDNTCTF